MAPRAHRRSIRLQEASNEAAAGDPAAGSGWISTGHAAGGASLRTSLRGRSKHVRKDPTIEATDPVGAPDVPKCAEGG